MTRTTLEPTHQIETVFNTIDSIEHLAFRPLVNWSYSKENDARNAEAITLGRLEQEAGYFHAEPEVPEIARYVDNSEWGDLTLYMDHTGLFKVYRNQVCYHDQYFLHGNVPLGGEMKEDVDQDRISLHFNYFNIDLSISKAYIFFAGLEKINEGIRDFCISMRMSAWALNTQNYRQNLYMSGPVDLNYSELSEEQREEMRQELYAVSSEAEEALETLRATQDVDTFLQALACGLEKLVLIKAYVKKFTVHFTGHSHMDLAWKWRYPEALACMRGTLENQFAFMDKHPDYVFIESSAVVWKDLAKDEAFLKKMQYYVDRGQLELVGGMAVEPDSQLPAAQSYIEQFNYGRKVSEGLFGKKIDIGLNIDAFGFNRTLPKFYLDAGFRAFITQKLRYSEYSVFENVMFWWKTDDGRKLLSIHLVPDHYNPVLPEKLSESISLFHLSTGSYHIPILFGIGNRGGGPTEDMFERIEMLKNITIYPHITYSSLTDFLDIAEKEMDMEALPVLDDELFLETHHKTFTVQGEIKAGNSSTERELTELLAYETLNTLTGKAELNNTPETIGLWDGVLFNQFHDVLPGTSLPQVNMDSMEEYERIHTAVAKKWEQNAQQLSKGYSEEHFTVFNSISVVRDAYVSIERTQVDVYDDNDQLVPSQEAEGKTWFKATDLPALGFKAYRCVEVSTTKSSEIDFESHFQSEKYELEFDREQGAISSLKVNGKELVSEQGLFGYLDILEDIPTIGYSTWNIHFTGKTFEAKIESCEIVNDGPLFRTYRVNSSFVYEPDKHEIMGPFLWNTPAIDFPSSFFTIDFRVYRDEPTIQISMNCDWWESNKFLKMRFDSSIDTQEVDYGLAAGTITRPSTDKARFEVPALGFAEIHDDEKSFLLLSDDKYGFDCKEGSLGLSLLTSPSDADKNEVPDPLTDRGRHQLTYSIKLGHEKLSRSEMHLESLKHRSQPKVFWGELTDQHNLGNHLSVTGAIPFYTKPTDNGVYLYLFEANGEEQRVEIKTATACTFYKCNLLGEKEHSLSHEFNIPANGMLCLLLEKI
ncbi:glycoside hydrolase family 38 C-terminal domain-containing protein [Kiritimatiellota bacterium B12222]|nr:glycoside hydrolase family 38 C-terminal domain-containing protein [Kiritimatiellota bacterium B12222]